MITLKTNKPYMVQIKRQFLNKEVYIKVNSLKFVDNLISYTGIYYVIVEGEHGEQKYILDSFHSNIDWSEVEPHEGRLTPLDSVSLKNNILTRLKDFTMLTLRAEGERNFGINPSDWTPTE